jgi:hypothetical protein
MCEFITYVNTNLPLIGLTHLRRVGVYGRSLRRLFALHQASDAYVTNICSKPVTFHSPVTVFSVKLVGVVGPR